MKMTKTLLGIAALLAAALVINGTVLTVKASESRVFDEAGLFTEEEAADLQTTIDEMTADIKMDIAVVTTEDAQGKTSEEFADDYYEEQGFGTGNDHSGALCLIDMDNRQLYISTEGEMIRYLTDDRIERILDDTIGYVGSEEYGKGTETMLTGIAGFVSQGVVAGQYNYDRDTGAVSAYHKRSITWYEVLFALIGAGVAAIFPCIATVKKYKMESERRQALNYHLAYKGTSSFAYRLNNDLLINKMTSQRRIVQNTGGRGPGSGGSAGRSTTHRSSGGRTHGGGGRGF